MSTRALILTLLLHLMITVPAISNRFTTIMFQDTTIDVTDAQVYLSGKYQGKYQQQTLTLLFTDCSFRESVFSKLYIPSGRIQYAGKSYDFKCISTESNWKYEVQIKRPTNPALLGEFLAWKAYLKVKKSGNIELTVFAGLSLVEKLKYSLPNQGAKIVLNHISDKRKTLFEKATTFSSEDLDADAWYTVTYFPNGTCTFDGGVRSDEEIEGEYTRFHSDGRYYILNMAIHVIWEDDNQEAIYNFINNGNQYRDGKWILQKQE